MSSTFGKNIKISIAGQSHSKGMGVIIDGFPAGFPINEEALCAFLARRVPGQNAFSTKRKETDYPEFLSGLVNGVTCGAPLLAIIQNNDTRSADYEQLKDVPRPSHADYSAQMKYKGFQDVAGGGHFSGRLTAPLCVAGGICAQYLKQEGIQIFAHIKQIHHVKADEIEYTPALFEEIQQKDFPVYGEQTKEKMQSEILAAANDGDSVGGIVECVVFGLPAGVGEPIFDRLEGTISSAVFGIPAIRGIEFGNGFASASLLGSENNDSFYIDDSGLIRTETNHSGGMLGGISNGMPVVFRVAIKPTPSIAKEQQSISLSQKKTVPLKIKGRHDPCIVQRAVPVLEAATALAIMDLYLEYKNTLNRSGRNEKQILGCLS